MPSIVDQLTPNPHVLVSLRVPYATLRQNAIDDAPSQQDGPAALLRAQQALLRQATARLHKKGMATDKETYCRLGILVSPWKDGELFEKTMRALYDYWQRNGKATTIGRAQPYRAVAKKAAEYLRALAAAEADPNQDATACQENNADLLPSSADVLAFRLVNGNLEIPPTLFKALAVAGRLQDAFFPDETETWRANEGAAVSVPPPPPSVSDNTVFDDDDSLYEGGGSGIYRSASIESDMFVDRGSNVSGFGATPHAYARQQSVVSSASARDNDAIDPDIDIEPDMPAVLQTRVQEATQAMMGGDGNYSFLPGFLDLLKRAAGSSTVSPGSNNNNNAIPPLSVNMNVHVSLSRDELYGLHRQGRQGRRDREGRQGHLRDRPRHRHSHHDNHRSMGIPRRSSSSSSSSSPFSSRRPNTASNHRLMNWMETVVDSGSGGPSSSSSSSPPSSSDRYKRSSSHASTRLASIPEKRGG